jgi:hypothetical protein
MANSPPALDHADIMFENNFNLNINNNNLSPDIENQSSAR